MRTQTFAAFITALTVLPAVVHAEGPIDAAPDTDAAADAALEEELDAYEEEYDEEYGEEVEYCGGEESIVDIAYGEYYGENIESAREILVDALKHGNVEEWNRANALALLAEIQLRMGDYRPAAYNYGRAIQVDPTLDESVLPIAQAAALHRSRRSDEAIELVRGHVREHCSAGQSSANCHAAFGTLALLTDDPTEMFESLRSAGAIRAGSPDVEDAFETIREAIESR